MLKAWLRFFRAVNLPTVPGDIWVGVVSMWCGAGLLMDSSVPIFWATGAGGLLYMFGLADNDIVGATTDAGRPIPEGKISLTAARVARALCLAGVMALGFVRDPLSGTFLPREWWWLAMALLLAEVGYNRTKAWFLMGVCRGLNVLCGGAVAYASLMRVGTFRQAVPNGLRILIPLALVWTVYIAAITKYSEGEDADPRKRRIVGLLIAALVPLQALALVAMGSGISLAVIVLAVLMWIFKKVFPEVSAS